MKKLLFILLLIPTLMFSQYEVEFGNYTIPTESPVAKNVIDKYIHYMEKFPVKYEQALRNLKEVKISDDNARGKVAQYKGGVIYLNPRLGKYPFTKKAVILHYILQDNGFEEIESDHPHVMSNAFNMSDRTERMFKAAFINDAIFGWIVRKLKEDQPLESTL